jgi:DNA repair protein RadC
MSNRDLLAVLVGEAVADNLLIEADGSLHALLAWGALGPSGVCEPNRPHGWEQARLRIDVAREMVRRAIEEDLREREVLSSPDRVRDYLKTALSQLEREVFLALLLDAQNRLIAARECFAGTLTQTAVYPREVVKLTLAANAAAVIFAHNHPSGAREPSQADITLTQTLVQALRLVDVKVLDHFIVAGREVLSFAERGLI